MCTTIVDVLISVVIPVFNGETHLRETLESALQQDYPTYELIVVDDGSTDGSKGIAESFGPLLRCIHQSNAGTAGARNRGIQAARGDFLAFLDQDDLWLPKKLSLQMEAIRKSETIGVVFTLVKEFIDPSLKEDQRSQIKLNRQPKPGIIPSAALMRRRVLDEVGLFREGEYLEWAEWYTRFAEAGIQSCVVPEVLVKRRIHLLNKGRSCFVERKEYARIMKAALDRRRTTGEQTGAGDAGRWAHR
jgi:glycosyltransferase involved in cell wall biosynthesis